MKIINQLSAAKTCQNTDTATKIIKFNKDILAKYRIKINDCFSFRHEIECGVPQGSILGPLLFNIDLIDLFFICENDDIASYADDTTP